MWQVYINFTLLALLNFVFLIQIRYLSMPLKVIGYYSLVTTIFHCYAAYYFVFKIGNNQFIFHFLTPIQYSFFCMYFFLLQNRKKIKIIIVASIPFFILASFIVSLTIQNLALYNSYSLIGQNFLIAIWALLYFKSLLESDRFEKLERKPTFFISAAILVFSLGDFFIEGILNYMINNRRAYSLQLYYISEIFSFILYGIFILSFIMNIVNYRKKIISSL
jgi:hypothetical protein